MKPLITIQILNWNRAEETQESIQSALDQSYENIEIVIIDNGSSDNSIELTKKNFPEIKLIQLDKNYGCPGGRNRGMEHCNGEYIFYLDNDGVLHKDAVKNAYETTLEYENVGIVTGAIYEFQSRTEIDSECEIRSNTKKVTNIFNGGISMHKKDIYNEVGIYPDHFMYGYEETYLSLKLSDTPYKIIQDNSVVLWHKGSDVARDSSKEIIGSYFNKLYTSFSLFPLKKLIPFVFYFLFRYPQYARKQGIQKMFWAKFKKDFVSTIKMGLRNRNPISGAALKRFNSVAEAS